MATLSGGAALERKLREIAQKTGASGTLRVGFLEGSTYPNGTPVPLVAAINEYGRTTTTEDGHVIVQPPRPFFRNMIEKRAPKWAGQLGKIAVAADYDMTVTLERMGLLMAGQLQKSIRELVDPELSDYTIKKKGFSKPLIDTSVMINSVSYEVKREGVTTGGKGAQMSPAAMESMKAGK